MLSQVFSVRAHRSGKPSSRPTCHTCSSTAATTALCKPRAALAVTRPCWPRATPVACPLSSGTHGQKNPHNGVNSRRWPQRVSHTQTHRPPCLLAAECEGTDQVPTPGSARRHQSVLASSNASGMPIVQSPHKGACMKCACME